MWNENFVWEINFHWLIFHFIREMHVSYTKIPHMKLWTSSFHMWIRYFLYENVPISYLKMFQFRMFFTCERTFKIFVRVIYEGDRLSRIGISLSLIVNTFNLHLCWKILEAISQILFEHCIFSAFLLFYATACW